MTEPITTATTLTQQIEDIKREITDTAVQAMVEQTLEALATRYEQRDREREERSHQFIVEMRQTMVDELAQGRRDWQNATRDYVTREEVEQKAREYWQKEFAPLKEGWQDLQQDFNRERERTQKMIDQRIDQILEVAQTAKTLGSVNEKDIAAIKATNDQRYEQVQKDIASIKRDIDGSVKSVEEYAKRIEATFAKFVTEAEKRIEKIEQNGSIVEREVVDLQATRVRTEKRLDDALDDAGNLRQDVDGLRADIATKVTTTDLKVKHIDSELNEIKQRQSNQSAEVQLVKKWVIDIQVQTKAAFWLLNTWGGRTVLVAILTMLGITNLVS